MFINQELESEIILELVINQSLQIEEIFMTKELVISTINNLDEPFSFDEFLEKLLFIK